MSQNEEETSESGNPIYRYEKRTKPFEFADAPSEEIDLIELHIDQHIGSVDTVLHELISDLVHLDVHHIKPTKERNFHTLITTGMSDRPMSPPEQVKECKYSELLVTLPPEWALDEKSFKDESNYWIVRLLKFLARFPHEYDTWLWWGHTMPNGNPPQPFHESNKFVGAILLPPVTLPQEFLSLKCNDEKEVHFFSVVPLYQEEMDLKLKKGTDALMQLFDKHGINEVIDINRKNVAKKWWHFN